MRSVPRDGFDVVLVGGGPAGAATAIALLGKGRSVVVIERSHYKAVRIGESLPPRARLPLRELGVWERFIRGRHLPSPGTLAAWGRADLAANDFALGPYGSGWHLDRVRFDDMLAWRVAETGGRVLRGVRMRRCVRDEDKGWSVETDSGEIRGKFLVDATGRPASVARQMAVRHVEYDRLVGIAATAEARTQDARALVESSPDGWWYSALLPNSQVVVAYMTDADLVPKRNSELRAFWERELAAAPHTCARVGSIKSDSRLNICAANSFHLTRVVGKGWLAVGDAACALDPLSSRGLYDALKSGLSAGAAIDRYLGGDARGLKRYAAKIRAHFARYLELRASYYSRELRWREAPFWKRRRANRNFPAEKIPLKSRENNMEDIDDVS